MEKRRVLIFIDWFYPGYKAGGPTTSNVNIVEHLKDEFDFYVVTTDTDYHEACPYQGVTTDRWIKQNGYNIYYFSKGHLSFAALKKCVKEAACNVWYVNGIYSRFFSIYPVVLAKMIRPKRVIVSARGMLSPHALAIKSHIKKGYLFVAKLLGLFDKVTFHATNDEEKGYIRNLFGKTTKAESIENLPRKMLIDYYYTAKTINGVKLVSFARISPEKNTLFAIKCLKYCKSQVTYHIYGQINSQSYWNECVDAIKELPGNVNVEYKGTVAPGDMANVYRDYNFLYLPSTGENFGHAILESFINSTPVIISDKTPWTGLADKSVGWDLPLSNGRLFADTIDMCAALPEGEYRTMTIKAYEFAKSVCDNQDTKHKYIELFSL